MGIDSSGAFTDGLKTSAWLQVIGINHIHDVVRIGVVEVCMQLKRAGYPVSVNMAYGLQADIMGVSWKNIPEEIRHELRTEFIRQANPPVLKMRKSAHPDIQHDE